MKNEEKQVLQELARKTCNHYLGKGKCNLWSNAKCDCKCAAHARAKEFYDNYYSEIIKDCVVLSKEEYENIYEQAEQNVLANIADGGTSCQWCIEQHEKKASKETAEKFAEKFENGIDKLDTIILEESLENYVSVNAVLEFIDELAEQFSVEVKDNKND